MQELLTNYVAGQNGMVAAEGLDILPFGLVFETSSQVALAGLGFLILFLNPPATSPSYKDFSSEAISLTLVFSWLDFSSILLISGIRYS